jgi:hypothetical protein
MLQATAYLPSYHFFAKSMLFIIESTYKIVLVKHYCSFQTMSIDMKKDQNGPLCLGIGQLGKNRIFEIRPLKIALIAELYH